MKKRKRKLVRRAFTIWSDQDERLNKLAGDMPGMDKSKILRYLLGGSLSSLEKNTIMRAVLCGNINTWEESERKKLEEMVAESGDIPF